MPTVRKSMHEIRAAKGRVDRGRFSAVSDEQIANWKRDDGIDDSVWGPARIVVAAPDTRAIREKLGLSQEAFAERFQLSLRTVQDWEQRRRLPEGPARILLQVIEREPDAVTRALADSTGRRS